MGSKANFQQAPVHWPREITKAKLSQAKSFFIHIFLLKQWKKRGKGKFGQFLASLGKFGQQVNNQQKEINNIQHVYHLLPVLQIIKTL